MSLLFSGSQTEKQKVPLPHHHLSLDFHILMSSSVTTSRHHQPIHWSLTIESCDTISTEDFTQSPNPAITIMICLKLKWYKYSLDETSKIQVTEKSYFSIHDCGSLC
jgi:hypothetical protein